MSSWLGRQKEYAVPKDYPFLDMRYPCPVKYNGRVFPSAENAYQSTRFTDPKVVEKFCYMPPNTAAYKGVAMKTTVKNWQSMRTDILYKVLASKFSSTPMREKLKSICPNIVVCENTWHENDLGICTCPACRRRGHDLAGKALTLILSEMQSGR